MKRFCVLVSLFVAIVTTGLALSQGPTPQLFHDEATLKRAGIAVDGPALLDYFRKRTPSPSEQAALKQKSVQLGSGIYSARIQATDDLIRAGRMALPYLREVARKDDAETARRAQYCIGVIEQNTRAALAAPACRVLVARNPPGALETLLAYLPFVDETWVEEEIRYSMKPIALANGKAAPLIEKALEDKEPKRRGAAAWFIGQSSDPKQRRLAHERLRDESNTVRFLAASALLSMHEADAVPTLISLLSADPDLAWRAEDLLFRLTDENGPHVWLNTVHDNNGRAVQSAWEDWWTKNCGKIDWKSLRLDEHSLGLTLVVENQRPDGGSRIYETTAGGEIRFEVKIHNPIDAQWLPGGRLLVGDSRASLIYEIDARGNKGWSHAGISPTSIQRLPNGNTVVSTYQSIIEFTREGKTVFSYPTQGHTYHARKLPDGHYIWIDACGEIGEVDVKGKLLAKVKLAPGLSWGSIERLRNGRFLVALGGTAGKVQEVDMTGRVFWEKAVSNPNRAVRLASGHTLVASHGDQAVYEFDPNGNERWKHATVGRPFAALRR